MASSTAIEQSPLRQRTVELMDSSFLSQFKDPYHRAVQSIVSFIPYSFKELKDVDLVEFSALRQFGMLKYVASLQRHCVPSDVFFWGMFNTDASDERLLVTGTDGRSNMIGWSEIMMAFGGDHSNEDEFRGNKIMHKQLLPYRPSDFLPETIEKNLNKELVSGKEYEEVFYYREAAPYGPTYYLMTLIAEVFWSHSRSNRFLMPMVYAYVRALHGHPYNWAKAILKSLKSEISYLQKEARSGKESLKSVQIVWAPVFVHLLYTFRHRIFAGSNFAEHELWVGWTMMSKEGDLSLAGLVDRFPDPIIDTTTIREGCMYSDPDDLPEGDLTIVPAVASSAKAPTKNKPVKNKMITNGPSDDNGQTPKKRLKPSTAGPRVMYTPNPQKRSPSPLDTPSEVRTLADLAAVLGADVRNVLDSRYTSLVSQLGHGASDWKAKFEQVKKAKAEGEAKAAALQKALKEKELSKELHTAKAEATQSRSKIDTLQHHIHVLNERLNQANRSLADQTASLESGATRTQGQITGLQNEVAKMKGLKASWDQEKTALTSRLDSLRAEHEAVMKLNEASKMELQAAVDRYKLGFDKEMERVAELQLQKDRVEDELSTLKFSLQRAENNHMLARQELAQAKVQLRRFQLQEGTSSSPAAAPLP
ncbi:hypothetical protein R1sor_021620 [Riccia sorocarpa]|uniref:Aminotransferase-like plant mobile domain-containing protein n=1 Tax=Riccia sorocarpa TaxID=122646 RepID=A0ABD3GNB6_9MARC